MAQQHTYEEIAQDFCEEKKSEINTTDFTFERVTYNGTKGWFATRRINGVYSGKQFGKTRAAATDAFNK